jgi:hypothetical protein
MIETGDLIRILKAVPEMHLRILSLCHELIREDDTIDGEKVAFYSTELTEATKEAQQYSHETQRAAACLKDLARLP